MIWLPVILGGVLFGASFWLLGLTIRAGHENDQLIAEMRRHHEEAGVELEKLLAILNELRVMAGAQPWTDEDVELRVAFEKAKRTSAGGSR